MTNEDLERLTEIKDEIQELVEEAKGILPCGTGLTGRAESYWIPHILTALEKNNGGYLGGSMTTMQDTIDELSDLAESDESDD